MVNGALFSYSITLLKLHISKVIESLLVHVWLETLSNDRIIMTCTFLCIVCIMYLSIERGEISVEIILLDVSCKYSCFCSVIGGHN